MYCFMQDLVVNVGDVAHIADAIAAAFEPALHHVEGHHHARMAYVAKVVNRHAADIHADMARLPGRKRLQGTA